MENRNDQNIKVVIPPRADRKKKKEPEPVQAAGTQPVRVSIPPRHGRTATPPPQTRAPQGQAPQGQAPQGQERKPAASEPVQIRIPPRAAQNHNSANRGARTEMSFEQLAQLASSVVMIMVHDKKGEPFASGSGIMIGRKGYILTNNHVLSEGSFFTVRIENDDNCYKADQIIKYNQVLDLAVIRIDRELLPLPIYKGPQKLVRGQKVVAIGSPLGLFNSVSDGIIAGFRVLDDVDMIQYTAPTSPGSSGGAVLNMYGEVIGISTAIAREAQGINWAVGYEFINLFTQGFIS
ncbi:MAG: trypsin-like peptidase domain-containing protein [Lachnospiraceae bacterium]|nr:trypsin-like peptidase domain-containing protein [Lachnospiraceae bacterium]MDE7201344.1 trypsin-like peptidase domain-containing protein [Lachnospiraceae bacterium]